MSFIVGLLFIAAVIANFVYLVMTLIAMARHHIGWAIGGFFFSFIVHLVFFFSKKQILTPKEYKMFIGYFATVAALVVVLFLMVLTTGTVPAFRIV